MLQTCNLLFMNFFQRFYNKAYPILLSEQSRVRVERFFINFAIFGFIVHLLIISLVEFGFLPIEQSKSNLLGNYIAAIYTPFSFILIYEVYLLVYYLPKSITVYIGKQYEIVSLIIIRRIFKDISNIEMQTDWFTNKYDLQLTADIVGILLLYLLIFVFYRLGRKQKRAPAVETDQYLEKFIAAKRITSFLLAPILVAMALYSFTAWVVEVVGYHNDTLPAITDVNQVFYRDFFTLLILVDVLLLLISFRHTEQYNKLIRNSGFIISTILIKVSFGTEGLLNTLMIVSAVAFGVMILFIHNLYEREKIATG